MAKWVVTLGDKIGLRANGGKDRAVVAPACFEAFAAGPNLPAAMVHNRVVRLPVLTAPPVPSAPVPAGARATSRAP